jgi:hypothetical protein
MVEVFLRRGEKDGLDQAANTASTTVVAAKDTRAESVSRIFVRPSF